MDRVTTASAKLPPQWTAATIDDVALVLMGQSPPSSTYNHDGVGLPFFQGKAEFGELYPEMRTWCSRPTKIALGDDILMSVRAPVGPTNLAPGKCCIGRGLASVRPETDVDLKYLLYACRRYVDELDAKGTGTTFKAISGKTLRELPIPVAPTAEQSRIAEALDELFSDLDAGVAVLERAREKLKLYRASVLKAAVEGSLTADWRRRNPPAETGGELLKRILVERRRRWEKDQIRKFHEKGKTPPRNWKARYKEPVAPDVSELPALPEGWCWASFDQIGSVQGGLQKTPARAPRKTHHPYLRVANVHRGSLDLSDLYRFEMTPEELERLRLEPGDILVVEGNGSRTEIGRCAIWSGEVADCVHQNHIIRVRPFDGSIPRYLDIFLNSPTGQMAIQDVASSTSGLYTLSITKIKRLPLPLPSVIEQEAVVEAVEGQLSTIERLESDIETKLESAQALRQAILKHAFSGKLVPQDPKDEPASELLERIAAEREAREEAAALAKRAAGAGGKARRRRRSRTSQRCGGIDFDKLETERRRLGIKGDEERWPKEFDDPTFSRQVLGLEEEE